MDMRHSVDQVIMEQAHIYTADRPKSFSCQRNSSCVVVVVVVVIIIMVLMKTTPKIT